MQYFSQEKGVCKKILDFIEESHGTAQAISNCVKSTLAKHDLPLCKVSAFCVDYTNANLEENILLSQF